MTRQVREAATQEGGIHAKLTSLQPMNPANLPDAWERAGLESFAGGGTEAMEITWTDGQPCIRLMHPVFMESMCMKCHEPHGAKVGDLRGAISVSIPADFLLREEASVNRLVLSGLGIVWLAGLSGIWLAGRHLCRRLAELPAGDGDAPGKREALPPPLRAILRRDRPLGRGGQDRRRQRPGLRDKRLRPRRADRAEHLLVSSRVQRGNGRGRPGIDHERRGPGRRVAVSPQRRKRVRHRSQFATDRPVAAAGA